MGTRMRMLTVGLALAAAVMAGCSSTTAGSSGAMQDDATAPASASSSAVPTAAAPSTDPATPTAEPTGATASPVASPTDPPSPADSPDDPALLGSTKYITVCDSGLAYECGDTGPGGGTIFYVSSTAFACGADMASFCNYLEAAPNLWAPNSQTQCKNVKVDGGGKCGGSAKQTSDFAGNGKGITLCTGPSVAEYTPQGTRAFGSAVGTGYANTTILVPLCNPSDAPNIARAYDGGGMTDWFVPSLDEMQALWAYPNRNAIGGFPPSAYWSSTNLYPNGGAFVTVNSKNKGYSEDAGQTKGYGFRPIRAF